MYSVFPKVVALAQPKLVAQTKVVAFSAQLLLETHYTILFAKFLIKMFIGLNFEKILIVRFCHSNEGVRHLQQPRLPFVLQCRASRMVRRQKMDNRRRGV